MEGLNRPYSDEGCANTRETNACKCAFKIRPVAESEVMVRCGVVRGWCVVWVGLAPLQVGLMAALVAQPPPRGVPLQGWRVEHR